MLFPLFYKPYKEHDTSLIIAILMPVLYFNITLLILRCYKFIFFLVMNAFVIMTKNTGTDEIICRKSDLLNYY